MSNCVYRGQDVQETIEFTIQDWNKLTKKGKAFIHMLNEQNRELLNIVKDLQNKLKEKETK